MRDGVDRIWAPPAKDAKKSAVAGAVFPQCGRVRPNRGGFGQIHERFDKTCAKFGQIHTPSQRRHNMRLCECMRRARPRCRHLCCACGLLLAPFFSLVPIRGCTGASRSPIGRHSRAPLRRSGAARKPVAAGLPCCPGVGRVRPYAGDLWPELDQARPIPAHAGHLLPECSTNFGTVLSSINIGPNLAVVGAQNLQVFGQLWLHNSTFGQTKDRIGRPLAPDSIATSALPRKESTSACSDAMSFSVCALHSAAESRPNMRRTIERVLSMLPTGALLSPREGAGGVGGGAGDGLGAVGSAGLPHGCGGATVVSRLRRRPSDRPAATLPDPTLARRQTQRSSLHDPWTGRVKEAPVQSEPA